MKMKTYRWEFREILLKKFMIAFHYTGLYSIQLGLHIDIKRLNLQIHIPFGFIHIGADYVGSNIKFNIDEE